MLGVFESTPKDAADNNKIRLVLNSLLELFIRYSPVDSDSYFPPLHNRLLIKTMDMSLDRSLRRFVKAD